RARLLRRAANSPHIDNRVARQPRDLAASTVVRFCTQPSAHANLSSRERSLPERCAFPNHDERNEQTSRHSRRRRRLVLSRLEWLRLPLAPPERLSRSHLSRAIL